ncbi:MAG: hypothetical protein R3B57_02065 [Phycisphaerales bacterium]
MLCENCNQREATIHEVLIKGGTKVERHLCETCAQQAGVQATGSPPISELITKYMMSPGTTRGETPPSCPSCGMGYAEFRQSGLLGCPGCYDAFETAPEPAARAGAHEGGRTTWARSPAGRWRRSRRAGRGSS